MYILGISAFYHDSAAALLQNDTIIAAAQEERFTRKKHDAHFPKHAIQFCLREAGIELHEVNHIVFYEKPFLKFERLLETPRFHALLNAFKNLTGCPILVNTSFNVRGEPIVCSPLDAFRCFMGTELDVLVVGDAILYKEEQNLKLKQDYKQAFELD